MNRQVTDEQQYLDLLSYVAEEGIFKGDRTGTGTLSKFGQMMRFDLTDGKLPLLTTKQMFYRSFIHETLWFISGSTDVKYLKDQGISIWDSWVIPETAVYRDLSLTERSKLISTKGREANDAFLDHIEQVRGRFGEMVDLTPEITEQHMTFLDQYDIPRQTLISGSIGPGAYGAMWRNIEDTRIVTYADEMTYLDKGFDRVCSLGARRTLVTRKIDQLQNAIDLLRTNPDSRRIIVHAFDNRMTDFCALPPCHSWFQFWTRELTPAEVMDHARKNNLIDWDFEQAYGEFVWNHMDDANPNHEDTAPILKFLKDHGLPIRALSTLLMARSQDLPVGTPFNFAQYALLTHMVAQVTNMVAEELIWVGGDAHIYVNQVGLVGEQVSREVIDQETRLVLNRTIKEIDDFTFDDLSVKGYDKYHPSIKYPVAI